MSAATPMLHGDSSLTATSAETGGRSRIVIENVSPSVDAGRFPVKRSVGERVRVEADVFGDGHDRLSVALRYRAEASGAWQETAMQPLVNDRWAGEFGVSAVGWHEFTVVAWVDRFATWRHDLQKRVQAGQDVAVELEIGAGLVAAAAENGPEAQRAVLESHAAALRSANRAQAADLAAGEALVPLLRASAPRLYLTEWSPPVRVWVDRERARFSSWYELFPRSASPKPGAHGTLRDVQARLDDIASMGFDVLYLPPIHPIGRSFRKGRNNSPEAGPEDVGSPWAIGGPEGGHDAIHPALGTFDDFDALVRAASERGVEVALDLAFQCSADHPYVKEHPEWFRHRPDGTIQYAENPPKKYEDIHPFDFECDAWESLWKELLRVVEFWHGRGVRLFRVDNPHTKPFGFWEWLIGAMKRVDPNVLFLAEAFTRPKVMYRLAKVGFTQSYTYFTWRNEPWELERYFTELTTPPVADFFRPNAWPNTPDILPEYLQTGGRAAFIVRAVLAATLCGNYGVYGPAFELMSTRPLRAGGEEYLDSEKYQLRTWDVQRRDSLKGVLARLNRIRRENPALQQDRTLRFHACDNQHIVCYTKTSGDNAILVTVNTDPHHVQWAHLDLDTRALGISGGTLFQVHDLLSNARYRWHGNDAVVGLDPEVTPAHVFRIRRHVRTEADFDYFT